MKPKNEQEDLLPNETKVKTPGPTSPNLEQYLGCGCYQFYHLILCQFVLLAQANNMTFMVFGKIVPKLECSNDSAAITVENWTQLANNQCAKYVTCKNVTVNSIYRSLVQEFMLICDDKLIFICLTVQMIGVILGAQIGGQLSDWYGRKWFMLICDDKLIFICLTVQMIGVILGAQIGGQLSDWYGRKWIIISTKVHSLFIYKRAPKCKP
uniref:Major facilitator superfamily (MFS) profile domain-containing protein n=1 Tax=Romanomermis culicivorax TaxID=13658 RepID=A0A915KV12_ROMCU